MHVAALSLTSFRSWAQVDLTLHPGVTTIIGSNGRGKTNLMEALGYLATLSSHRVATDAPLVMQGASAATVQATVVRDGRSALLEIDITPGKANKARLNRNALTRPRDLLGILTTVLFAPEDLALVKGDPDIRRRFLDDMLISRSPRYAGVRADYERVLKQRNALLKSSLAARRGGRVPEAALSTLQVWSDSLATLGAELTHGRLTLLADLHPHIARAHEVVSDGQGPLSLTYAAYSPHIASLVTHHADVPNEAALQTALTQTMTERAQDELDRGVTLVGPHRDDLLIELRGMPAKGYASHGESWSIALAMRLGCFDLLTDPEDPGSTPVLILDDVFAELDTRRRQRLVEQITRAEQVLITAAVASDVPEGLTGRRLVIDDGRVIHDDAAQ